MVNYHVGCGLFEIYAGTLNSDETKWLKKSVVTNEAIKSVAQYLLEHNEALNFDYKGKRYRLAVDEISNNIENKESEQT